MRKLTILAAMLAATGLLAAPAFAKVPAPDPTDTTAPAVVFTETPEGYAVNTPTETEWHVTKNAVKFRFVAYEDGVYVSPIDESATFECLLTGGVSGGWEPCKSPSVYTNLPAAKYQLHVRATDASGNVSGLQSYTFYVDPKS